MIETGSEYGLLDFNKLGFMFAIQKIDPREGKMETVQYTIEVDGSETLDEIPMVECF